MEILLKDLENINTNIKQLGINDWIVITNNYINVNIIICHKKDEILKNMIYEDVVKIYLEHKDNKSMFYHNYEVNFQDLLYYIKLLLSQKDIPSFIYVTYLMNHGLHENDIILFLNCKKGMVASYKEGLNGTLFYNPINKNGAISNRLLRLYPNIEYTISSLPFPTSLT